MTDVRTNQPAGMAMMIAAYLLWAIFPLYFAFISEAGAFEIAAHRIVWTFLFCLAGIVVVTFLRSRRRTADSDDGERPPRIGLRDIIADRRLRTRLVIAGVFVTLNWLIYAGAVITGHTVDAALGYFINPLVTVLFAVLFLGERLRPLQIAALGICLVAVVVMVIGYGQFPWIGLALALTFGMYSFIKYGVPSTIPPLASLASETALLSPIAFCYLVFLQATGASHFLGFSTDYTIALALSGVITAAPLLCFAYGASRLPLTTVGLIQYVCPIGQFAIGVWVFGEPMPLARWIGFALIWVALVFLSTDALLRVRRSREHVAA
ncbi:MAG: EamA family transporter RarD [Propionibacteriaceae bacterium]|nr:EamA family transporter RarD [Propionibacteriaceae bacterium]